MYQLFKRKFFLLPIVVFFIGYLIWLFRAYYDVAYMDQIQILAGNMNHMLNHDASVQDYYYRSPFLFFISTILVFINSKLFAYNTFVENIVSGIILLLIALYYIRTHAGYFSRRNQLYFSVLAGLVIFTLVKWEMSLWGGGFSHYMVVFFGFVCIDMAHKYYLRTGPVPRKNTLALYVLLSLVSILEATAYFLPFQASLLVLLLVNYRLFPEKVAVRQWRVVLGLTVVLIAFSFLANSLAEWYSAQHPYDGYGKVNMSQNMGDSFKRVTNEPGFVVKFFLSAHAGTLIDKDSYPASSPVFSLLPVVGVVLLLMYGYALYLFVKRKKLEGLIAINLIVYTLILYATILVGRLHFNDVYYGASSRYTAASFAGILGLATFFLLLLNDSGKRRTAQKLVYAVPLVLIVVCSLIVNKNQWQIAPYRKQYYIKMAENLKTNTNLESLMGYNNEIAGKAREVMIRHRLNVFKPETKLNTHTVGSTAPGFLSGFHEKEGAGQQAYRWTTGEGVIDLPNLYTTGDTVKVKLACYVPQGDTPVVVLNDRLLPFQTTAVEGGYEYLYAFQEQKVLFKAVVRNKSFRPQDLDKASADVRNLGLIFHSLTLTQPTRN
ncbi:MAG TPA: hypothetical protein VGE66_14810 [Chitinophagaceae bacterium]